MAPEHSILIPPPSAGLSNGAPQGISHTSDDVVGHIEPQAGTDCVQTKHNIKMALSYHVASSFL